ncbi:Crp/Fnr family transcriptional regulator [Chloroflexales bacterium ZM16-3]|nr:Crp/Fnr family transcriptional regulator [Chloroflexales bacterium ZM16-3]
MRMDDPGEAIYLIVEGTVKIAVEQPDGSSVILAILGAGEVIGEMSVVQNTGRSATIITLERSTMLWMNRTTFQECMQTMSVMATNLARILASRLRLANEQILLFATQDVYGRVACMLLAFAREHGRPQEDGSIQIPLRLTQTDLASLVGASRVRVNQVLSTYKDLGHISLGQKHYITLHDIDSLSKRSQ